MRRSACGGAHAAQLCLKLAPLPALGFGGAAAAQQLPAQQSRKRQPREERQPQRAAQEEEEVSRPGQAARTKADKAALWHLLRVLGVVGVALRGEEQAAVLRRLYGRYAVSHGGATAHIGHDVAHFQRIRLDPAYERKVPDLQAVLSLAAHGAGEHDHWRQPENGGRPLRR